MTNAVPVNHVQVPSIERHLIASLLWSGCEITRAEDHVQPEDFVSPACRAAYEGLLALPAFREQEDVDLATLAAWLTTSRHDACDDIDGWLLWLKRTRVLACNAEHVEDRALTVGHAALGRSLGAMAAHFSMLATEWTPTDHEGQMQMMDEQTLALVQRIDKARRHGLLTTLAEAGQKVLDSLDTPSAALRPTGLADLDNTIGGLTPKRLVVIGARSGDGKSTLALQIALNRALVGDKVLMFSLEMPPEELSSRAIANLAGIEMFARRRAFNVGEKDGIAHAISRLTECGFSIYDKPEVDIRLICAAARKQKETTGLDLLVVDYLQLVECHEVKRDGSNWREREVATAAKYLRKLSQELDCVVIAPVQLNDEGLVRESRAIKNEASLLMILSKEEDRPNVMLCDIEKHRVGEAGRRIGFYWDKPHYRCADLARSEAIYS
jgi:replicative DNA helicase